MILVNIYEQAKKLKYFSRYNGGWIKKVEGLDKTVTNGWSILGEFINTKGFIYTEPGSKFIDCSISGSRKNQFIVHTLFRVDGPDSITVMQTVINDKPSWAVKLWESIEL